MAWLGAGTHSQAALCARPCTSLPFCTLLHLPSLFTCNFQARFHTCPRAHILRCSCVHLQRPQSLRPAACHLVRSCGGNRAWGLGRGAAHKGASAYGHATQAIFWSPHFGSYACLALALAHRHAAHVYTCAFPSSSAACVGMHMSWRACSTNCANCDCARFCLHCSGSGGTGGGLACVVWWVCGISNGGDYVRHGRGRGRSVACSVRLNYACSACCAAAVSAGGSVAAGGAGTGE